MYLWDIKVKSSISKVMLYWDGILTLRRDCIVIQRSYQNLLEIRMTVVLFMSCINILYTHNNEVIWWFESILFSFNSFLSLFLAKTEHLHDAEEPLWDEQQELEMNNFHNGPWLKYMPTSNPSKFTHGEKCRTTHFWLQFEIFLPSCQNSG